MAGHSKWANIRFRKAAQDARRGKLFTKLIREITIAARSGGGDAAANPRLRTAVDKALAANMPRDTIDRAIQRGTGDLDGVNYEEIRYEGYGPGGAALMLECTTDNRNRTVSEVRHVLTKHGGRLGAEGSVAYLFDRVGLLICPSDMNEDAVMEAVVPAGAEDVENAQDGSIEITTSPEAFAAVRGALEAADVDVEFAAIVQRPSSHTNLSDDASEKVIGLMDALDELDDVQEIFTNAQLSSEVAGDS